MTGVTPTVQDGNDGMRHCSLNVLYACSHWSIGDSGAMFTPATEYLRSVGASSGLHLTHEKKRTFIASAIAKWNAITTTIRSRAILLSA